MSARHMIRRQVTLKGDTRGHGKIRLWLTAGDDGEELLFVDWTYPTGTAGVITTLSIEEAEALLTCLRETLSGVFEKF
jgi:hypothetical protein